LSRKKWALSVFTFLTISWHTVITRVSPRIPGRQVQCLSLRTTRLLFFLLQSLSAVAPSFLGSRSTIHLCVNSVFLCFLGFCERAFHRISIQILSPAESLASAAGRLAFAAELFILVPEDPSESLHIKWFPGDGLSRR